MCLAAFALACHDDYPLVLGANRDEFFERPSAPLAWWDAPGIDGEPRPILAGRDLRGGGTWLGLNRHGRLALLTNVRTGRGSTPGAPTRGELVTRWLSGDDPIEALHVYARSSGHSDYNLVTADLGERSADHLSGSLSGHPSDGMTSHSPAQSPATATSPAWHWTSSMA